MDAKNNDWLYFVANGESLLGQVVSVRSSPRVLCLKYATLNPDDDSLRYCLRQDVNTTQVILVESYSSKSISRTFLVHGLKKVDPMRYLAVKLQKIIAKLQHLKKLKVYDPDVIDDLQKVLHRRKVSLENAMPRKKADHKLYRLFLAKALKLPEVMAVRGVGAKMKKVSRIYKSMPHSELVSFTRDGQRPVPSLLLPLPPPKPRLKKTPRYMPLLDLTPGTVYLGTTAAVLDLSFRKHDGVISNAVLEQQIPKYDQTRLKPHKIDVRELKKSYKFISRQAINAAKLVDSKRSEYTQDLQAIPVVVGGSFDKTRKLRPSQIYVVTGYEPDPDDYKAKDAKNMLEKKKEFDMSVSKYKEDTAKSIATVQKIVGENLKVRDWYTFNPPSKYGER